MPHTIESILASHEAATERRNTGQPIWDETVDLNGLAHNTDLTDAERYARIADRIKASRWFRNRNADGFDEFGEAVENLAVAASPEEFGDWMDFIYDQADRDRVWIKTR